MWTYRFAVVTYLTTFVLLLLGGVVHGTGSSLACPDWPLCFGRLFPEMKGNVLIEHGHRLVASGVGVMTGLLWGLLHLQRRDLSRLGALAVFLVCFQGLLGGLTVIYRLPTLISSAHLATSMVFLALLLGIVWRLRGAPRIAGVPPGTYRLLLLTTLLTYLQITLGGLVRHTGGGLACLDLPLCHGAILPIFAHPTVLIHALHRLLAVAVAVLCCLAALRLHRARVAPWLCLLVPGLVLVQGTLGVMSVLSFLGLVYVTAHLGGAALLLSTLVWLALLTRPEAAA